MNTMSAYPTLQRRERISVSEEARAIEASNREAAIWSSLEELSDTLCTVRGPLDFSATNPDRQQGREAMELFQRARFASSQNEREALLAVWAYRVYNDTVTFVEEQAAELVS